MSLIPAPKKISLASTEHYNFYSHVIGKPYKLFIAVPEKLDVNEPNPVVYILDANSTFLMAVQMIQLLQLTDELPPMLIVGIGYNDESSLNIGNRRIQEFTPTADPNYKSIWSSQIQLSSNGGDASRFLHFIEEELKPFIESRYSVNPDDATLVGDSLGGLFALYALLQQPATFNRYVIGSPVLFWDKGFMWGLEECYANRFEDLRADVFIGVGGQEDEKPFQFPEEKRGQLSKVSYIEDSRKMAETLISRNFPNLQLSYYVFEGETHMSVIAPWLNRGLRTVFQDITGKQVSTPNSIWARA